MLTASLDADSTSPYVGMASDRPHTRAGVHRDGLLRGVWSEISIVLVKEVFVVSLLEMFCPGVNLNGV